MKTRFNQVVLDLVTKKKNTFICIIHILERFKILIKFLNSYFKKLKSSYLWREFVYYSNSTMSVFKKLTFSFGSISSY